MTGRPGLLQPAFGSGIVYERQEIRGASRFIVLRAIDRLPVQDSTAAKLALCAEASTGAETVEVYRGSRTELALICNDT